MKTKKNRVTFVNLPKKYTERKTTDFGSLRLSIPQLMVVPKAPKSSKKLAIPVVPSVVPEEKNQQIHPHKHVTANQNPPSNTVLMVTSSPTNVNFQALRGFKIPQLQATR